MNNIDEYIKSGIIELYVLGLTSEEENTEILHLLALYPLLKDEIDYITSALIDQSNQPTLSDKVKPLLMATIDYTERLKTGEEPTNPPPLNETSTIADFSVWLNRADMVFNDDLGDTYAKIIGYTPQNLTAIVWLKVGAPYEVHANEYEKFLILEGTCNIVTKEKVIPLAAGDFFAIPLHMGHSIQVTSPIPCKVILQRSAA
jgi:mannose-6-phosphate isomerase-like protein (cupin superfamily)